MKQMDSLVFLGGHRGVAVVIPVRGKSRKILASEKEMRFCQGDALCCLNITIAGISS
jgi:hypothetical protein